MQSYKYDFKLLDLKTKYVGCHLFVLKLSLWCNLVFILLHVKSVMFLAEIRPFICSTKISKLYDFKLFLHIRHQVQRTCMYSTDHEYAFVCYILFVSLIDLLAVYFRIILLMCA